MKKEQRQQQILHLIEQSDGQQIIGTRALAEELGVSEMTVRRDFQELSLSGLLRRQYGGAFAMKGETKSNPNEVGIILTSSTGKYSDPFFNAVLEGADRKLHELGYRIAYINTRAELTTAEETRDLLRDSRVSGIILVGPNIGEESIGYIKAHTNALVGTTPESVEGDFDTVTFAGRRGIRRIVDHLVKLGRRRLAFVTGQYDSRWDGFVEGIEAHNLPADPELRMALPYGLDGWTPELGHAGARRLMSLENPPDAIVCASDRIAIGAIQWLVQHGYRVPEDIAVTGFDNITESAFTVPPLTTVNVHKQLMGELAAERVVKRIENDAEIPLLIQTPTELVIRQSCGSLRA